jgi:hypothetical protein
MKNSFLNSILEYRYQTNAYIALLLESGYFESGISKELSNNILNPSKSRLMLKRKQSGMLSQ